VTKIYAHRGSKGNYPENSMLAFKKAIDAGACGIELDVHLTKDGEVVVIHDATLDRTTTGTGYVKDYTLAEIRKFSIGAKFGEFKHYDPSWDDEVVPTLSEVLLYCKEQDVEVNVELKTYEIEYQDIEEATLEVVKSVGFNPEKMIYSSFHLPTILRIAKLAEDAKIAWASDYYFFTFPADHLQTLGLEAVHMDVEIVLKDPKFWQQVASSLRVWTVNDEKQMKELIDLGVEAIITDYPEIAVELQGS